MSLASSSTQSIAPLEPGPDGLRILLLVYIHGFLGNEMSFQSFPAHVHNLLSMLVSETHVIHTKIYPRYKSRKAIEFARDEFSVWLEPNETPSTDVVLLGHSMGGLLAAEITLLPPRVPSSGQPFRHRIIGTIGFDCPYLGMHPGVVASGISSLFRPAPQPQTSPSASQTLISTAPGAVGSLGTSQPISPLLNSGQSNTSAISSDDPNFNPPFPNDIYRPQRTGWNSVLHFISKHSDELTTATKQYLLSHLEFGGCLADYSGLKKRYAKLRALEDVDDLSKRKNGSDMLPARRVRFMNYWTASAGVSKKPKTLSGYIMNKDSHLKTVEADMINMNLSDPSSRSGNSTPRIYTDEYGNESDGFEEMKEPSEIFEIHNVGEIAEAREDNLYDSLEIQHIDPVPINDSEDKHMAALPIPGDHLRDTAPSKPSQEIQSTLHLPPMPLMPQGPDSINLDVYTDKDSRKIAEKEKRRGMKAHKQVIRDREGAIKDRLKAVEKREKEARQNWEEKQFKAREAGSLQQENEEKCGTTLNLALKDGKAPTEKPKRDKKFCMLPPSKDGEIDKCWIRIYMEDVDEVGAHCGLFFQGAHYESLIGDVGNRIEEWLNDDASRRIILEESGNLNCTHLTI